MNSNVKLLDNTRKIEKLLHDPSGSGKVVFNDICEVMGNILNAGIYVISRKGKVLGFARSRTAPALPELLSEKVGSYIDENLNERFLSVLSTNENVILSTLGFEDKSDAGLYAIITPIQIAGERLGTIFIYKENGQFGVDDLIICEYGTTVVGMEMLRAVTQENAEERHKRAVVKSAMNTLSYTETQAIHYIFDELSGKEGILVASKIADKAGITRSVVVNALRKFESAGVILSRSSGMKGTYIKVLNDAVYEELAESREQGAD
ncbi:MAG: GTP-sensing pleiotropic transcriptional regulator CodY [Lachnospiraceae bacterium]|nr:GTP-sensing pleiotropic transcriptional regulator CodY [Lachnospiraceae bacterium]